MTVRDLMTTNVLTVSPEDDLGVALALMYEFDIRRLPVMDVEQGQLVGIISDRDLRLAVGSPFLTSDEHLTHQAIKSIKVEDIMSTGLIVIGPQATLAEAARRMLSHKVNGLPVVEVDDDGDAILVGIITSSDLLRHIAEQEQLWHGEISGTMKLASPA